MNMHLNEELWNCVRHKKFPQMTYIPACSWGLEEYFKEAKSIYMHLGFAAVGCFPVDTKFSARELQHALTADVIYLSGGNTFYFLKYLRENGMLPKLKKFVENGGVLMGLSAGSIIMTPSITLAGTPKFDCDPNDVKLKNLKSLGLVHFEFFPHYSGKKKVDGELLKYSKAVNHPVYACADGDGIVVDSGRLIFHGDVTMFYKGKKVGSLE